MNLNNQLQPQQQRRPFGERVLSAIGSGLDRWAEGKIKEMDRKKESEIYHRAGFRPEIADFLTHIREVDPAHFSSVLQGLGESAYARPQQQGMQSLQPEAEVSEPSFEKPANLFERISPEKEEAHKLKVEQRKDKLRPDLNYLDDLQETVDALREEINNQKDPVKFGLKSELLTKVPGGKQFLSGSTGAFDALSNKFHTDATQGQKGVRSVYHVKILGASKPGLDKTKEQNEKILDHWEKVINQKKERFLKDHPEFKSEAKSPSSPVKSMQEAQEKKPNVRIVNGKKEAWNPAKNAWVPANW